MTNQSRRGFLLALAAAGTAGCSSMGSGGGGGSDDPFRGTMVEEVSETIELDEGDHQAYEMTFTEQTVLIYSIIADKNVDAIVFGKPKYREYKNDKSDQVQYVSELSELNTKVTAKGSAVTKGRPVLVIDNTTWAKTPPVEDVTVQVELEAFVRK